MKANTANRYSYYACHRPTPSRYPNSVKTRSLWDRLLDTLLGAAITVAFVAIALFLLLVL